jgi:hypothetical protein
MLFANKNHRLYAMLIVVGILSILMVAALGDLPDETTNAINVLVGVVGFWLVNQLKPVFNLQDGRALLASMIVSLALAVVALWGTGLLGFEAGFTPEAIFEAFAQIQSAAMIAYAALKNR